MRGFLFALSLLLLSASAQAGAPNKADRIKELLHEKLPNLQFSEVLPSPVKGLYEVHAGRNVLYVDSDVSHIVIGEIYDLNGRNLTAETRKKLFKEFALRLSKDFPTGTAIHFKGKKPTVFVVADPDCPFCRRTLDFLLQKGADVYVIFVGMHPESYPHSLYVLSSKDKKKALQEVISGKLDGKGEEILKKVPDKEREKLTSLLDSWKKWSEKYSINGVPFVIVPSRQMVIQGAQLDVLNRLYPIDFSKIDLSRAPVVVGKGTGKKVVVITDPTCPFCRKACNTLRHYADEGKATFYVFFLPVHGNVSMKFLADIFNSDKSERPEILKEIFLGKWSPSGKPMNPKAEREFRKQLEIVNELGVSATPTFIFPNGEKVEGADIRRLEKLIKGDEK